MFDCTVQCYPWDLVDEDIDLVLDRLQGQVGATAIGLVVACDHVENLRPHVAAKPRVYRTSGGVFHKPDDTRYETTRLRPAPWGEHRNIDMVARTSERCAARRLDLWLMAYPFHSQRIVAKHTDSACKNLLDVPSRRSLCPSNADVREYIRALLGELSVYDDASTIVIGHAERPSATDGAAAVDADLLIGPVAADLLSLCFCESCLQMACAHDVDGPAALHAAQRLFDERCHSRLTPARLDDPHLARYREWSQASFADVLAEFKSACGRQFILNMDLELAAEGDALERNMALADACIGDLSFLQHCPPEKRPPTYVGLHFDHGVFEEAPELVREITSAAECGARGVIVTHYGAVLEDQFDWIHQGLRNARRMID